MKSTCQEDIETYIEAHISEEPEWLYRLNRRTNLELLNGRMCSGRLQGRLLKMLTEMIRPERAIELGTFSGYSALCIAEGMSDKGRLDTIEANDELEHFIRDAFKEAPDEISGKISLHIGDAAEIGARFEDNTFEFAFIDADKRQYSRYFRVFKSKMKSGGIMIFDNTLWDGHVTDPEYQRDPQTCGIREFNDMISREKGIENVILPVRDGLTIIRIK